MDTIRQDLVYAVRRLRQSPGFTLVAVLSLALGIGANTAIFSLVDGIFNRPSGLRAQAELVDIFRAHDAGQYWAVTRRDFEEVRNDLGDVFSGVTAYGSFSGKVEKDGVPSAVHGELVTGEYFDVLGVTLQLGRGFLAEEDAAPGTHPVAVLSHRYWTRAFGADPAVLGTSLVLNGRQYTVVGVAPPSFQGKMLPGVAVDLFVPLSMGVHLEPGLGASDNMNMTARLRPGVGVVQARAAVDAHAAAIDARGRESRSRYALSVASLAEYSVHPGLDGMLKMMAGLLLVVVALVLLIACSNLASLLLARASDRQQEIAVRLALGAGRGALVRQLLTESVVLGVLAGGAGLLLGVWAAQALLAVDLPIGVPIGIEAGLNVRVLAFTFGASLLAAALFGLAPALRATRPELSSALREGSTGVIGGGRFGMRNVLVVGQVALSVVLLIGAGLFLRSLQHAGSVDVGFSTAPAAVIGLDFRSSGYDDDRARAAAADLVRRIAELPGVDRAGGTARLPLGFGIIRRGFEIPGVEPPTGGDYHGIEYTPVTAGFLEALGVPVQQGRTIDAGDRAGAQRVALVTRAGAERFWPGESPVGRTIRTARQGEAGDILIVGVTGDIKIHTLGESPQPYLFVPAAQEPVSTMRIIARGSAPVPQLIAAMRAEVRAAYPDLFIAESHALSDHIATVFFLPRMAALMLSLVGGLGLTLAVLGLYGVVSYDVARRAREMGIRLALGAQPFAVVRLVMVSGLGIVAAGAVIGIAVATGVMRFLQNFLFGIGWADPVTFIGVPALLGTVAAVAALVPALRASRVDPLKSLRPR
jgi:macrolide transport system ATP-binding/permease protein